MLQTKHKRKQFLWNSNKSMDKMQILFTIFWRIWIWLIEDNQYSVIGDPFIITTDVFIQTATERIVFLALGELSRGGLNDFYFKCNRSRHLLANFIPKNKHFFKRASLRYS